MDRSDVVLRGDFPTFLGANGRMKSEIPRRNPVFRVASSNLNGRRKSELSLCLSHISCYPSNKGCLGCKPWREGPGGPSAARSDRRRSEGPRDLGDGGESRTEITAGGVKHSTRLGSDDGGGTVHVGDKHDRCGRPASKRWEK